MKRIILIRLLAISTITACTTYNTDHAAVPAEPVPYPDIVSLRQINCYSDVILTDASIKSALLVSKNVLSSSKIPVLASSE